MSIIMSVLVDLLLFESYLNFSGSNVSLEP